MRITGGKARGILLQTPKGDSTRPATDRTREAVFSSLGTQIEGSVCVDLFAGTGSYGFEALSRGAQSCLFFDCKSEAIQCLKKNKKNVSKSADLQDEQSKIFKINLMNTEYDWTQKILKKADCIFLDPPYALLDAHLSYFLESLSLQFAHKDSILILECPSHLAIKCQTWTVQKRIGSTGKGKPNSILLNRNS
jgi:16S rRNA (guanine966-N2)-methyltransferase